MIDQATRMIDVGLVTKPGENVEQSGEGDDADVEPGIDLYDTSIETLAEEFK